MGKRERNIQIILIFFSLLFLSIIIYLTYFEINEKDKLLASPYNKRLWEEEQSIIRGSILDRNGIVLAKSSFYNGKQTRLYEGGVFTAHITGFSNEKYGRSGIEAYYNGELLGLNNRNPIDYFINKFSGRKQKGNDVYLTIDYNLQKVAYYALGNNKGAVVALNPQTGEILAMVSKPSFDPNRLDSIWDALVKDEGSPLVNRAVQGLYPPGSVFKVVTGSAFLEGRDALSRKYTCEGYVEVEGRKISDFEGVKHGSLDIRKAMVVSCNSFFIQAGLDIGMDRLKRFSEAYFFNREIPFDLPVKNSVFPTASLLKNNIELAEASIGQGKVLVSPLHMAMVVSAIANDGVMMKPFLVSKVMNYKNQIVWETYPQVLAEPVSSETARLIKEMMVEVVEKGTGKEAKIYGVKVAGKTGTAEVEGNKSHAWFIGFAPSDKPKIAVAVVVENGGIGGIKAAPIARAVMEEYLRR